MPLKKGMMLITPLQRAIVLMTLQVRCDAGIRGLPCTNCTAFSVECSIPPKKKEREGETVGALKRYVLFPA